MTKLPILRALIGAYGSSAKMAITSSTTGGGQEIARGFDLSKEHFEHCRNDFGSVADSCNEDIRPLFFITLSAVLNSFRPLKYGEILDIAGLFMSVTQYQRLEMTFNSFLSTAVNDSSRSLGGFRVVLKEKWAGVFAIANCDLIKFARPEMSQFLRQCSIVEVDITHKLMAVACLKQIGANASDVLLPVEEARLTSTETGFENYATIFWRDHYLAAEHLSHRLMVFLGRVVLDVARAATSTSDESSSLRSGLASDSVADRLVFRLPDFATMGPEQRQSRRNMPRRLSEHSHDQLSATNEFDVTEQHMVTAIAICKRHRLASLQAMFESMYHPRQGNVENEAPEPASQAEESLNRCSRALSDVPRSMPSRPTLAIPSRHSLDGVRMIDDSYRTERNYDIKTAVERAERDVGDRRSKSRRSCAVVLGRSLITVQRNKSTSI